MAIPLEIQVCDKAFKVKGTFGDPLSVTVNKLWLDAGTAEVAVRSDHSRLEEILAADGRPSKGARLRILDENGGHVMSGRVTNLRAQGPSRRGVSTIRITDDFEIFKKILGWPKPAAALTAQSDVYWTATGPTETLLLSALSANATRLGLPLSVPASAGRGPTKTVQLRMAPLYDAFFPAEDGLGMAKDGSVGIEVRQTASGLAVHTWTPKTVPQQLSEESAVIDTWAYDLTAPNLTRAVAGGSGDGVLRIWRERNDAALESAIGMKLEGWKDAAGVDDATELYNELDGVLVENAGTAGLELSFAPTPNFRYGKQWVVGDVVQVNLGGVVVTDRLTSATMTWTADGGFQVVPHAGDAAITPDGAIINLISRIARAIRKKNASR